MSPRREGDRCPKVGPAIAILASAILPKILDGQRLSTAIVALFERQTIGGPASAYGEFVYLESVIHNTRVVFHRTSFRDEKYDAVVSTRDASTAVWINQTLRITIEGLDAGSCGDAQVNKAGNLVSLMGKLVSDAAALTGCNYLQPKWNEPPLSVWREMLELDGSRGSVSDRVRLESTLGNLGAVSAPLGRDVARVLTMLERELIALIARSGGAEVPASFWVRLNECVCCEPHVAIAFTCIVRELKVAGFADFVKGMGPGGLDSALRAGESYFLHRWRESLLGVLKATFVYKPGRYSPEGNYLTVDYGLVEKILANEAAICAAMPEAPPDLVDGGIGKLLFDYLLFRPSGAEELQALSKKADLISDPPL